MRKIFLRSGRIFLSEGELKHSSYLEQAGTGGEKNFLPGLKVCRGSYDTIGIRFSRICPPLGYMLCFG